MSDEGDTDYEIAVRALYYTFSFFFDYQIVETALTVTMLAIKKNNLKDFGSGSIKRY